MNHYEILHFLTKTACYSAQNFILTLNIACEYFKQNPIILEQGYKMWIIRIDKKKQSDVSPQRCIFINMWVP